MNKNFQVARGKKSFVLGCLKSLSLLGTISIILSSELVAGFPLSSSPLLNRRFDRGGWDTYSPLATHHQANSSQSGIVVTNTNDSGEGSLRQAILDANQKPGNETIYIDKSLSGKMITLVTGPIPITDDLTLKGLGAHLITIANNSNTYLFQVDDGNNNQRRIVNFDGFTLKITGNSALIKNREEVHLSNILIQYDGEVSPKSDLGVEAVENGNVGIVNYAGNIIIDSARKYTEGTLERILQEATQYFEQGQDESSPAKIRQAIAKWEEALLLARKQAGDRNIEAGILKEIGDAKTALLEPEKALDFYNQSLSIYLLSKNSDRVLELLPSIGSIYDFFGTQEENRVNYKKILLLCDELKDCPLENELFLISLIGEEAIANYQKILARCYGSNNCSPEDEAKIHESIGLAYLKESTEKALTSFEQVFALTQRMKDSPLKVTFLINLSNNYKLFNQAERASLIVDLAFASAQKIEDDGEKIILFSEISKIYLALKNQQKALEARQNSLSSLLNLSSKSPLLKVDPLSEEALNLENRATAYYAVEDTEKALELYDRAYALYQKLRDDDARARILRTLGEIHHRQLKNPQKALEYYATSLEIEKAAYLKNLERFRQFSEPLGRNAPDNWISQEINYFEKMAPAYEELGEKQKALELYDRILDFQRIQTKNLPANSYTTYNNLTYWLYKVAVFKQKHGYLQEAAKNAKEIVDIVESIRTRVASQKLRQSYFATVQKYYQFYIDLLMQLHQKYPQQGYDGEALHISERARARSLIELLTEASANIRSGADRQLLERERNLQQQLNYFDHRQHQLLSGQYNETELKEIKQKIEIVLTQLKQVETQIRSTSSRYADLKYPEPLNLQQIQQQVLDEDTLLLEYYLGENNSYLWVVSKDNLTSYILPKQSEIEAAVQAFRTSITKDSTTNLEPGLPLSQILLGPIADRLGNKRLLIVGDGVLQYVPFAALPIPSSPTNPLLVQNEIVTLPSISTVAIQRRQLQNRSPVAKILAAIADPIFHLQDSRAIVASRSQTPDPPTHKTLQQTTRNLGLGGEGGGKIFDRLEFTRVEADKILALVPENQRFQAFDFNASRQIATHPDLSQYQIVHFATHGLLNPVNPELSGIVLSLYDQQGNPEDGFLRLHDIFNLNLPAELVVLSACETGLGTNVKGEGLVGLTRGFMYAGARRVVVSLWSVNDRATSEIMAKFYQKMLQGRKNPVTALREAQLEMWNSSERRSPYYWAAFTIQGDWR